MPKRRAKRAVRRPNSSSLSIIGGADPNDPPTEKNGFREEVSRQSAATRAVRDMEIEQLLTQLRLLRSCFNKEQLQTPLLQFFKENLPNLVILSNGKDGQCVVQWRDKDGNMSMNQANGSMHTCLLQQMSTAYPNCSAAMTSFHGFEFSSKAVKTSLLAADNLQIRDFVLEEPSDTHLVGLQGFQTPGVSSQRLSVGVTPKTLRLPKHGEMLLSVHGSPLGVYKEDNMEAIHELEEG